MRDWTWTLREETKSCLKWCVWPSWTKKFYDYDGSVATIQQVLVLIYDHEQYSNHIISELPCSIKICFTINKMIMDILGKFISHSMFNLFWVNSDDCWCWWRWQRDLNEDQSPWHVLLGYPACTDIVTLYVTEYRKHLWYT